MTPAMHTTDKKRLHYVDFMKGLCILFIVVNHCCPGLFDRIASNLNFTLESFRIPMYYFISGIFFKLYDGFGDFTRRKINNMIIPLMFFFGLSCLFESLVSLIPSLNHVFQPITLELILVYPSAVNIPLWFLVSLFAVNVFYYTLRHYMPKQRWVTIGCLFLSVLGYTLTKAHIHLPFMLNTALLGLPYFALGAMTRQLGVLEPHRLDRWGPVVMIVVLLALYPFAQQIDFLNLVLPNFFYLYLAPATSILSLLWACKRLPHLPVICYYGRYSLIVLGTHFPLIRFVGHLFYVLNGNQWPPHTLHMTCIIVLILELLIIKVFVTLFPRFTAQKDFFEHGWNIGWLKPTSSHTK